ncbi:MGH1-like glycoside hydrolase domain-containing protein [Flavivirga spongiicola]|uniref:Trehalase family glycosidase n=1 Tax=Flavivirga spongiicola TaxID=421621 RepID=A0ABU7XW59_9FLAO|nr:trehalase family glycosidase [Flavivirga sp. MEBiC05379]MDO5980002.1 trehalase family glycosidase [Flavivirga sp. MEBiC05379]
MTKFLYSFLTILCLIGCNNKHKTVASPAKPNNIPTIVYSLNPDYVTLYNKAWDLAKEHVKSFDGLAQSPYIDEAFDENTIWIWDTAFMLHFFKYASHNFPAIESLSNFYAPIHDNLEIPLRIEIPDNPPLFAWTEYDFYKFSSDTKHVKKLLYEKEYLQKHFEWFDTVSKGTIIANSAKTWIKKDPNGYLWEGGRSGMDNTPRGRKGVSAKKNRPNNPDMLWVDAIAQQGLSALNIYKLFTSLGDNVQANIWKSKYDVIKQKVNKLYWDEEDGIYYDINKNTLEPMKLITPASYWPMLAEMCDSTQAERMVKHIKNPETLGGRVPWTTVPRNDIDFDPRGGYWRGSVWLPTAYMGIKAIQKYGYFELAHANSLAIIDHMSKTYQQYTPHTIWECYSPTEPKPAQTIHDNDVRPDFCGWSALGPISLMIENVIGFYDINAQNKTVKWNLHKEGIQGIKNLVFGEVIADIIYENGIVKVKANNKFTLIVNEINYTVNEGINSFKL